MENIGFIGYTIAAIGYVLLLLLLLNDKRQGLPAKILFCSVLVTGLWAAALSWQINASLPLASLMPLEVIKTTSWGLLLLATIQGTTKFTDLWQPRQRFFWFIPLAATILFLDSLFALQWINDPFYLFIGHLSLVIAHLLLIEYLYRQGSARFRWSFKPLAIALACGFVFDLVIYAEGLLFRQLDFALWYARGYVSLLTLPFILISVRRTELWAVKVFVSREVVFHSTLLIGAAVYLMLMAAAGYYIRYLGGDWSSIGQSLFLTLSLVLLAVLFLSESIRQRVKVFISKHFFSNRYDYRQKWLALNHTLETSANSKDYYATALSAICQLLQSPSGLLFKHSKQGHFELVSQHQFTTTAAPWQSILSQLQHHQGTHRWIIDVDEYDQYPEIYKELNISLDTILQQPLKVFVPLIHCDQLYGYFVLSRPNHGELLNYEDRDLLHTVGQQLANFLALKETSIQLMETSQFDAFNRMSAFMVHDLKNVIGQLSLLLTNAEQHRHNPEFIDDAFETLDNAVSKMNRMLNQLRQKHHSPGKQAQISLKSLLEDACLQRAIQQPRPILSQCDDLYLTIDKDKLLNIVNHLVHNAQDATLNNGEVQLNLKQNKQEILIQIIDNGSGMDEEFIQHRLFKPFDTTKGNAGMGIGAYEARVFIESIGGRIEVISTPDQGTTFNLFFPGQPVAAPVAELDAI